jgi:peptidoglycan/LPS O-acetylase OafA/YrhL
VVALTGDWGPLLCAPLLAYVLLWVSTVLPSPALVQRHDISYGCYIYAFPVQQLLAVLGLHRAGIVVYVAVTCVLTTALAVLSWRHLESPAVRLAGRLPRLPKAAAAPPRLRLEHGLVPADEPVPAAGTAVLATAAAVAADGVAAHDGADVAERVS